MPTEAKFSRVPRHVGLIPDGNRRWAKARGLPPGDGYAEGMLRGLEMLRACRDVGIGEVSVYGFTTDNVRRPAEQRKAFSAACVEFVDRTRDAGIALCVLGDAESSVFPDALLPYANRRVGEGDLRVNLLVNYGWQWDLQTALRAVQQPANAKRPVTELLASADVSRIDLVVRWGGMRRLSGFLPVQSVYSDIFVVDEYWPDFVPEHFLAALRWYQRQDVTLGG